MILATTQNAPLFHADQLPVNLLAFSLIKGLKHCNAVTCSISGDPKGICGLHLNEHRVRLAWVMWKSNSNASGLYLADNTRFESLSGHRVHRLGFLVVYSIFRDKFRDSASKQATTASFQILQNIAIANHSSVRLESRCALRLRYVDLVVSIKVAVEVFCCFTVFSR
jgi:hypothetical protein